ncbi:diaminopimelate decarboxylase [Thermonema lapsum]|uniref:Diaminopimelate decarboxylase n=1 Tax=Thermonema lapsum TaxID=28195 RepID=A0A846MRY0_9BACT|nr:diaminopimelate decarboxylase [Thermonema lapsum]NIK74191.1 diaminopimelate decarboxylase [Thermonema lapsum]
MELINRQYCLQGIPVTDLCKQFGTPLYVYDASKIEQQVKHMQQAFEQMPVQIKYALKALNNQAILQLMKRLGVGLDAVSIQEVELGLKAGFEPHEILFTPNSVGFEEIKQAVDYGVVVNIDNISILEQFGHTYGSDVPCCIRLNPHIMAGGHHKISTGHIDSKFGISILQMRHLQRVIQTYAIRVNGLHMHTGSDILDAEVFLQGARILFDIAREFPALDFIDFGSGFKVAYKEGDVVTDLETLAQRLKAEYRAFSKEYGKEVEIWFEPGKYLVSEAGYLLVKANVVKTTPATVFVGVNSGLNHLIRPMMYDAYHEIVNASNTEGAKRIYTVVGYICETDTFGWDRQLHEVREGDILVILNAGAYGFTMSSNYNARPRPAEVLLYKGKPYLIRKAESLDDLLRNQLPMPWEEADRAAKQTTVKEK